MYKTKTSKLKFILFFIFSAIMSSFQAQNQVKYLTNSEVEEFMVKNEKNYQDKNNGLGLAYELNLKEIPEFIVDEFKAVQEVMDVFMDSKTLKIYIKKTDEDYMDELLNKFITANKFEDKTINKYIFIY